MNFLIFGDQSTETFGALRDLKSSNNPIVLDFLNQADVALRHQISLLPQLDKERLPKLSLRPESFKDWRESSTAHPVSRSILTTTAQLVELLQSVGVHPQLGSERTNRSLYRFVDTKRGDLDLTTQCMLGSCTGLLSAAAATVYTPCTFDWIPLAVQIVCIAFRVGLHTSSVADSLVRNDDSYKSWSSVVQGKLATETIAEFYRNTVCLPRILMNGRKYRPVMADSIKAKSPFTPSIHKCSHSYFYDDFGASQCLETLL